MSDLRRSSRADRRRRLNAAQNEERRSGPPSEVTVYSQVREGELILFVQDPLIADNCASARHTLIAHLKRAPQAPTAIDLQKCAYIDTPGLSLLFEIKRDLEAHGRSFLLQNPSRAVLRMLNITKMARIFPMRMTNTDHELIPAAKNPSLLPSTPPGAPAARPDFTSPPPPEDKLPLTRAAEEEAE